MIAIEKQGQVVRVVNLTSKLPPKKPASKRGKVETFSRKSRRRMIDIQSRLQLVGCRITFVTLTFHYTHSVARTKAAFKRFLSYLSYHYPNTAGMWRLEFQDRGAPHYHLILYNLPYWQQQDMRAVWMQCTREDKSGVRVNLLRNPKQAMYYVSKYVAKMDTSSVFTLFIDAPYQQKSTETWNGRMWGVINKACLPFAERHIGVIVDEEAANYFWWCAGAGMNPKSKHRMSTSRVYSDAAGEIFEFALSLGGFRVDDLWHEMLALKSLAPPTRTKASYFFAGINTHH